LWSGNVRSRRADLLPIQDQIAAPSWTKASLEVERGRAPPAGAPLHNNREGERALLRAIFYEAKETEGDYLMAVNFCSNHRQDKEFRARLWSLARNYVK